MKCPICNIDMIVVEYKKIDIDHCLKCGGVWFDSGELELVAEPLIATRENPLQIESLFLPAESKEKKHRCPVCRKKMEKAIGCKEPEVIIDSCPKGEGLWFDGGELNKVLTHAASTCNLDQAGVLGFLKDLFQAK